MRTLPAVLAALVVAAGLAAAVPASATTAADAAPRDAEVRDAPDLPEQWRATYGGEGDDTFSDVVRTDDGGYLAVGWLGGDDRDGWAVKVDGEGEQEWSETLGESGEDRFWGVEKTDEGYLLAGRTDRDGSAEGWIVELGPDGEVRDERTVGDGAFWALEADESGYLLAGWTPGNGSEGWAVKLDENRTREWSASYVSPDGYDSGVIRAIVPTESGYYFAGKLEGDSDDGWALSVGPEGAEQWQATAGGPSRDDVWAAASADDGFLFAGETESDSDGPRDGWLVKFSSDGELDWEEKPGGEGTQWLDSAMRTDDGYVFTGSSTTGPNASADGYAIWTDDQGQVISEAHYGTDGWDKPWPAIRAHGGGYLLAGQTTGDGATQKDGWLVRIGEAGATATATATTGGNSSEEAIRGETATGTEESSSEVPGFGPVAALLAALLAAVAVARR